jgi:hypothetical protein
MANFRDFIGSYFHQPGAPPRAFIAHPKKQGKNCVIPLFFKIFSFQPNNCFLPVLKLAPKAA